MRKIKFRAWDKVNECMIKTEDLTMSLDGKRLWVLDQIYKDIFQETNPNDYASMQYTGLDDKNGKAIYEGDILKNRTGEVGYVAYLNQEAGFVLVLKDRDYRLGHRNTNEPYNFAADHEIVGNIFENSNLLEVQP